MLQDWGFPSATHRWTISGRPDRGVSHSLSLCSALNYRHSTFQPRRSAPSAVVLDCFRCTRSEGGQKGKAAGELFVCLCCQNRQSKDDWWIEALLRSHRLRGRQKRGTGMSALCDGWGAGRLYLWPHSLLSVKSTDFPPRRETIWGYKAWIW